VKHLDDSRLLRARFGALLEDIQISTRKLWWLGLVAIMLVILMGWKLLSTSTSLPAQQAEILSIHREQTDGGPPEDYASVRLESGTIATISLLPFEHKTGDVISVCSVKRKFFLQAVFHQKCPSG
tara:strand:+ start:149674 stop:150048 length:375 start_codon:yes stop_codon:yes gene_type:complete